MRLPSLTTTPGQRTAGVIVTCQHDDGPPLHTFHVPGGTGKAMARACELLDEMGAGWRVVSISTPATIFRDLQGTRYLLEARGDTEHPYDLVDTRTAERSLLARAGRLDLLAPLRERFRHYGESITQTSRPRWHRTPQAFNLGEDSR